MNNGFIIMNATQGEATILVQRGNALWKNIPQGGILLLGGPVTRFETRKDARAAIARTHEYFRVTPHLDGSEREPNEYEIKPLRRAA